MQEPAEDNCVIALYTINALLPTYLLCLLTRQVAVADKVTHISLRSLPSLSRV